MKRILLAFALLLVYTSVIETFPVADDEAGLPLRYPVWWRPSGDARSYWDPLIARLIWTHPALRQYYKELAGWETSKADTDRPSLLAILNKYEEHEPMLDTYREDNKAENIFDEEHPTDRREESQEENLADTFEEFQEERPIDRHEESQEGYPVDRLEEFQEEHPIDRREESQEEHLADRLEESQEERPVDKREQSIDRREELQEEQTDAVSSRSDVEANAESEHRENTSDGERGSEIADRKRRSAASEGRQSSISPEKYSQLLGLNIDKLLELEILKCRDGELHVNADLLEDGIGGLVGGLLRRMSARRQHPSGILDGHFVIKDTSAFDKRITKREAAGVDAIIEPVPETRTLNKVNMNDVDVNELLAHVRSADCTTELSDDDDSDSGVNPLIDADVELRDTPMLETMKTRSMNSVSVAKSED